MLNRMKVFASQTGYNTSKHELADAKAEAENILSENHFCGLNWSIARVCLKNGYLVASDE